MTIASNGKELMAPISVAESQLNVREVPKVDLHMHAETIARLDRLVSRRDGAPAHDWPKDLRTLAGVPPGITRLEHYLGSPHGSLEGANLNSLNDVDAIFIQWLTDALLESAAERAVLVEVRFGAGGGLRAGFMSLFREAENSVREVYPLFHAEALVTGLWPGRNGAREAFESALSAAEDGLAGIDFIPTPYDQEADWTKAYRWAYRAADAGLGITAHAGEFNTCNIAAALDLPGITRMGHGVYAASSPPLLDRLLKAGVTLECCLTSNVTLGAVPSLEDHPIGQFMDAGIPVTLATDDPVRLCTSIGHEYEIALSLGFGTDKLAEITANATRASFIRQMHLPK